MYHAYPLVLFAVLHEEVHNEVQEEDELEDLVASVLGAVAGHIHVDVASDQAQQRDAHLLKLVDAVVITDDEVVYQDVDRAVDLLVDGAEAERLLVVIAVLILAYLISALAQLLLSLHVALFVDFVDVLQKVVLGVGEAVDQVRVLDFVVFLDLLDLALHGSFLLHLFLFLEVLLGIQRPQVLLVRLRAADVRVLVLELLAQPRHLILKLLVQYILHQLLVEVGRLTLRLVAAHAHVFVVFVVLVQVHLQEGLHVATKELLEGLLSLVSHCSLRAHCGLLPHLFKL